MLVLTFISSVFYEFSSVILYVPDAVTHVLTIVFYVVDFSPLSIEYAKPHAIKIIAYCLYLCVLSDKYNADFKEKTYVLSLLELLMLVKM